MVNEINGWDMWQVKGVMNHVKMKLVHMFGLVIVRGIQFCLCDHMISWGMDPAEKPILLCRGEDRIVL
jgi:hypothetical protein